MSAPSSHQAFLAPPTIGRRLDGWKEIAAYLSRAERTVKRWESQRGLPTHRVPGEGSRSVYAFTGELDQWMKSKVADSEIEEPDTPPALPETSEPHQSVVVDTTVQARPIGVLPANPSHPKLRLALGIAGLAAVVATLTTIGLSAMGIQSPSRIHALFTGGSSAHGSTSTLPSESEKKLARDCYLKGRYEWNQRTPDSLSRALDLFMQAIVHDPGYAQAYVGLADTYNLLREFSTLPDNEAFQRATAAARKAVELDASLPEAHRALAYAEMYGNWDFRNAEKEFKKAIELNPMDPQARHWYANAFAVSGRFEEALEQLTRAQELDPSSKATLADKGLLLANAGDTKQAIEILREVERSSPEFRSPHFYIMRISLDMGDYPTFLAEGEKAARAANDPVLRDIIAAARSGFAQSGSRGLLQALYQRQREYYKVGKLSGTILAKTCVLMHRRQEALELLEEAYSLHDIQILDILSHPDLLTLKDEPRYKSLVVKIDFPLH